MQNLYLVRHASAEDISKRGDFYRPLTDLGREEAIAAGQISLLAIKGDVAFLSSSSLRTLQTAQEFAKIFRFPSTQIQESRQIYDAASPQDYFEVIHDHHIETRNILVFGHNPVITQMARALHPKVPFNMCKSAVLGFKVKSSDGYIMAKNAELCFCYYPKKFKQPY